MNGLWWKQVTELDPEQRKILKLPFDSRCLVSGPPGSGKTNLLMLRAKHLQTSKIENYQVLAFTNTLTRFIRASQGVPEDKICTADTWLDRQLWQLEGRHITAADMSEKRRLVVGALTDHLESHNKSDLIHTLLVDEVQDYSVADLELFLRFAANVFFAGDIRQQIYKSDLTAKVLEEDFTARIKLIELARHYRISHKICQLADRLAKTSKGHRPILGSCCYVESANPSEVNRLPMTFKQQVDHIIKRCTSEMDAFPEELIGIICPTNDILDRFETALGKCMTVQQQGEYVDFDESRPIVLTTMHGAKGLEFRSAHIVETQRLKKMPHSRELIYTSVTRAKTLLTIYHSAPLSDFLEDALKAGEAPPPEVPIEDLFES
jgi:superfamily I DNA/RNA helicase